MKEIPDNILKGVCKMGQGAACCRYIIVEPDIGIVCAKLTNMKAAIDHNLPNMVAQGDNCEGLN